MSKPSAISIGEYRDLIFNALNANVVKCTQHNGGNWVSLEKPAQIAAQAPVKGNIVRAPLVLVIVGN